MYGSSGMYGSSMYGSGGMYGSSMYGNSMYGGGGGMYGGGMYNRPGMYGSSMYGQPGGMYGGQPGMAPGPFGPDNAMPPAPPTAWQTFLGSINGVMQFFGRLSFLVDENAHAVHFFISALLQLLDRAGSLYGEVARFIIRVLFKRQRALKLAPGQQHPGQPQLAGPPGQPQQQQQQQQLAGPKAAAPGLPAGSSSSMPAAAGGGPASGMTRAAGAAAAAAGGGAPWRPPGLPAGPNRGVRGTPSGPQWDQLWSDS
jgi:peroxin-13